MGDEPNRWENVYQSKEEAETSWFEDRPQVSLDLIAATHGPSPRPARKKSSTFLFRPRAHKPTPIKIRL